MTSVGTHSINGAAQFVLFGWPQAVTHILVLHAEMRPSRFVESHDDGHHVLAVEDGCCQNVAGRELCQLIHKWAEVLILQRPRRTRVMSVCNGPWFLTMSFIQLTLTGHYRYHFLCVD